MLRTNIVAYKINKLIFVVYILRDVTFGALMTSYFCEEFYSKLVTRVVPTSVVDPVEDDQTTVFVDVDPPSVAGGGVVVVVFNSVVASSVVVGSAVVVSCTFSSVLASCSSVVV